MTKQLLSKITITKPIEDYQPGEYRVVYLTQFFFQGEILDKEAERLVSNYGDKVVAEYAPWDTFKFVEGPAI